MQENFQAPSHNTKWLDTVEAVSVAGSFVGAIASLIVNQAAIAAIPLSVTVALNLMNRRILLDSLKQNSLAAIAQVIQGQVKTQTQVDTLNEQLTNFQQVADQHQTEALVKFSSLNQQLQQLNSNFSQAQDTSEQAIAQLANEDRETQTQLLRLKEQLEQVRQMTDRLAEEQQHRLMNEQAKIAKTVDALREIETCTQSLRINPISANAFFNRGLSYQRLGDREAAIGDYTEAIKLNSSYAEAYQSRGLVYADLGEKKAAVQDLREAARLFFETGDVDKYQIARDLSKKFYDLDTVNEFNMAAEDAAEADAYVEEPAEQIAIESLFSF